MANKAKKDRQKWIARMCTQIRKAEMECPYMLNSQPFYDLIKSDDLSIPEIKEKAKDLMDSSIIRIWE